MTEASPLRVLVVTNMYPTADKPILGTFVAEQVASLRQRGLHMDVLFIDGPANRMNYLRGIGDLRRSLRTASYDLIHAHYVFSGMIARLQWRLPIVLTHHGIEAQRGWTAPLCRWTSRVVDRTIVTSPRVAQALGLPDVAVLPCGVDTELFTPLPQAAAREKLGLPLDQPIVLFVGAPRPEKRLSLIQAAVEKLQARRPEARLVLVHAAPRERIPVYMSAGDVLVLASTAEGSPMVVREAMACNLPIVSTDVGDVPELLGDSAGHYIAGSTPADLAEKLHQALTFGRRTEARARILPESLASVAERIEEIYRQVLAQKRPNVSR